MSPYKNKRKQRKFSRHWMRSKRAGKPWAGLGKIATEKIKRKSRMLPIASRNGRKPGTWLKAPPKRGSNPRKQR